MTNLTVNRPVVVNGCELNIGNRIHIKSIQGQYSIVSLDKTHMVITCGKWLALKWYNKGYKTVPITDFHAFVNDIKGWNKFVNS